MEGGVGKALEPTLEDRKNKKETPTKSMKKLEHEDDPGPTPSWSVSL